VYSRLRPLLFRLDAEAAHRLTLAAARAGQRIAPRMLARAFVYESPRLAQTLFGRTFENPVGLAAGMDKNARLVPLWSALGFGFVEVGSVTARPSKGNPRPRLFRLPDDDALVNRLGLNNDGAARIAARLRRLPRGRVVVGVNVAKTHAPRILGEAALADFRHAFEAVAPGAAFVTLNVSCPNTREGKTFEEPRALDDLLGVVMEVRRQRGLVVPVLVKLSPPLSDRVVFDTLYDEVVDVGDRHGVAGYVATNTASDRDGVTAPAARLAAVGAGGLSGAPLEARATHLVRYLYGRTGGRKVLVGVGGVDSAEAAYRKIRAGASLVELYTGLVYHGPGLVRDVKRGLVRLLDRDGLGHIGEAVGRDA
jgi:dihydroorotate dehydrogenase